MEKESTKEEMESKIEELQNSVNELTDKNTEIDILLQLYRIEKMMISDCIWCGEVEDSTVLIFSLLLYHIIETDSWYDSVTDMIKKLMTYFE